MQLELWNAGAVQVPTASSPVRRLRVVRSAPAPAIVACIDPSIVVEPEFDPEFARQQARALEFVQHARAGATRKAYDSDWKLFERWCVAHGKVALPATPATLALYLTHLATAGRKYSTIRRARIAIGQVHCAANMPRPDQDRRIRTLERGIGRIIGTREKGAAPLCVAELERAVQALEHGSIRDARDRALLLLGFASGYRSSDLVTLDVDHIHIGTNELRVVLSRSKEDQLGRTRTTVIPAGTNAARCPIRALQQWLELAGHRSGPLFRVISGFKIRSERMHPRAVTRAVQRAAKRAGIAGAYSSHSLRAGLATSADAQGHSQRAIQQHVGWTG